MGLLWRHDDAPGMCQQLQRRFRANTRRHAAALRSRNRAYRLRSALPRCDAFAFGRRAASSSSMACASAVRRTSSGSPFVSSTMATSSSGQHHAAPASSAQPGQRDDVQSAWIASFDRDQTSVQTRSRYMTAVGRGWPKRCHIPVRPWKTRFEKAGTADYRARSANALPRTRSPSRSFD